MSRRTFYELFSDREECLAAALRSVVELIEGELVVAGVEGLSWRERVRIGLWTILSFFEREPALARACVVQALRGGPRILEYRESILARLAAVLDEGRGESAAGAKLTPLTAEGLVGAAFSILYTRLLRREPTPLTGLQGELAGLMFLPYLGAATARRERTRAVPSTPSRQTGDRGYIEQFGSDPFEGVAIRVTYRTMRVLHCVAARPGASNRQIGEDAGMSDQGQVSKLLTRLERVGLLTNSSKNRPQGEANSWLLSPQGLKVTNAIGAHAHNDKGVA